MESGRRLHLSPPSLLSWSSGKDSAWALEALSAEGLAPAALWTTYEEASGRVGIHGVPIGLVAAQARSLGLPLRTVALPTPCPNDAYERAVRADLRAAYREGFRAIAFGDLFLADLRDYRRSVVAGTGLEPSFPLWTEPDRTHRIARDIVHGGVHAVVVSILEGSLPHETLGASYDADFLAALPSGVDPCGENGEFHSFCTDAPAFEHPIDFETRGVVRDGPMTRLDLRPSPAARRR